MGGAPVSAAVATEAKGGATVGPRLAGDVTAYRTGGVRPLQLPVVNKRHLGPHVAQRLGPAVDALLSAHQAAVRGG
eukprot:264000-Lingulodinium_polyedra.AAC.1